MLTTLHVFAHLFVLTILICIERAALMEVSVCEDSLVGTGGCLATLQNPVSERDNLLE
jgi:hypothetical protein